MTTPTALPSVLADFGAGNATLVAAVEAVPGYAAHAAAKAALTPRVQAAAADLAAAQAARADLARDTADALLAGAALPADVPKRAAACHDALTRAEATVTLLKSVTSHLTEQSDAILRGAPSALLDHLNGQLQAAVMEARALDLAAATDAEEAIEVGSTEAWSRFATLRATALYIREAQRTVMTRLVDSDLAQHLDTFGAVRNYAALFPRWFENQQRIPASTLNGEPVPFAPPWPTDPPSFWLYAATHPDLDAWVPTPDQLREAVAAATTEARQNRAAKEAEEDSRATPEQRARLRSRAYLERMYLP